MRDTVLTAQIKTIFTANRTVYEAPRIPADLSEGGVQIGRKRVARLMGQADTATCHRRETRSGSSARLRPQVLFVSWVASSMVPAWDGTKPAR